MLYSFLHVYIEQEDEEKKLLFSKVIQQDKKTNNVFAKVAALQHTFRNDLIYDDIYMILILLFSRIIEIFLYRIDLCAYTQASNK